MGHRIEWATKSSVVLEYLSFVSVHRANQSNKWARFLFSELSHFLMRVQSEKTYKIMVIIIIITKRLPLPLFR